MEIKITIVGLMENRTTREIINDINRVSLHRFKENSDRLDSMIIFFDLNENMEFEFFL